MSSEVKTKIERFCAYQERCQEEVRQKLASLLVRGREAEALIADLIANGFLNEERFARTFARGKFRMKHWGRGKIEAALRSKKVSPPCIRLGMKEISDIEYKRQLLKLIEKSQIKTPTDARKCFRQLQAKGYEPALINDLMRNTGLTDGFSEGF